MTLRESILDRAVNPEIILFVSDSIAALTLTNSNCFCPLAISRYYDSLSFMNQLYHIGIDMQASALHGYKDGFFLYFDKDEAGELTLKLDVEDPYLTH